MESHTYSSRTGEPTTRWKLSRWSLPKYWGGSTGCWSSWLPCHIRTWDLWTTDEYLVRQSVNIARRLTQVHVREVENLDALSTPRRHADIGRLVLGKCRLLGNHRRCAAEGSTERGADIAAIQACYVCLCQHLCPNGSETARLVRGLAGRAGGKPCRLAERYHGVWEVRWNQFGGHLTDGEGGNTFGTVATQTGIVGGNNVHNLGDRRRDDGLSGCI